MRRRLVALALALLLGAVGAGCGKKGPPVEPERRVPAAPTALQGSVQDDGIVLTWTDPTTRADGSRLRDLELVRLFRHQDADGGPLKPAMLASGRVVGYEEVATIKLDAPAPAVVQRQAVTWVDRTGLTLGRRYVYVVTAEDSIGRSSAPSARLAVVFLAAPRAPRNLQGSPGDSQVALKWDPPSELVDGTPATGELRYLVLRGTGAEGPLAPVTPEPLTGTSFTDTGLANDTEYRWAVRAVRVDPRGTATGTASAAVAASPVDTTPPSPPGNLAAVPTPGTVRLAWNAPPEEDVALYAIYRAGGRGDFIRIGTTLAINRVYTDTDVRQGATYRYVVTALDRARTPNESARSNEVSVTVPSP